MKNVRTVNPLRLKDVKEALDWAFECTARPGSGPAVVVTRWPCVLKKYSEADRDEFGELKYVCKVDPAPCIGCKACVRVGCPAVVFKDELGKSSIDRNQCVGCEVCAQVCPKNAISREAR